MRKLVLLEQSLKVQQAKQHAPTLAIADNSFAAAVPSHSAAPGAEAANAAARAARHDAVQSYLDNIKSDASVGDVQSLLARLAALQRSDELPASVAAAAAAAATRRLAAAAGGSPQRAQAFLELALERRLLGISDASRALHALLQAYARAGDHRAVRKQRTQPGACCAVLCAVLGLDCIILLLHALLHRLKPTQNSRS
jgi:hypothetical protein